MGARAFTIAERCLRLTPKASAAPLIDTPNGFKYSSRKIEPGCAGLCMAAAALVIVDIVHLHCMS
jgi:hypothetical protein